MVRRTLTGTLLVVLILVNTAFGSGAELGKVEMYLSQGHPDKALLYLDNIIAAEPDRVDAYSSRAFVSLKLGRHQQAINDFSRVITLQPKDPSAYLSRGMVYDQLDNQERATSDFQRACNLGDKAGCGFLEQLNYRKK
ncbi:tetratricopeptide repeat protein 13 [Geobacter sp. OR-1]|uniref:tetratricopeptide repeat protein n=1 Tax=Geobacter sp. OR-1 TaxID=1266765 RepID=UPI000543D26D|nr:tetratricopeptide repeat protein [Geobacter sp. OR-1]GAM10199.1 tetratricopeptide repeat protein 13 [Geobacter sp. OR-1]